MSSDDAMEDLAEKRRLDMLCPFVQHRIEVLGSFNGKMQKFFLELMETGFEDFGQGQR